MFENQVSDNDFSINKIEKKDVSLEDEFKKKHKKISIFNNTKQKNTIRKSLRNFSLVSYKETSYHYSKEILFLMIFLSSCGTLFMGYNEAVFDTMESQIIDAFKLSAYDADWIITMISSFITIGACFGSLFSGIMTNIIGRKNTFLLLDLIALVGTVFTMFNLPVLVIIGRCLVGFGVGGFSYVCRLYLAEMTPSEQRGLALAIIEVFYIVGIQLAYIMGLGYGITSFWWRIMFGLNLGILLLHLMVTLLFFNVETPIFHYMKSGDHDSTRDILKRIYPIEEERNQYLREIHQISKAKKAYLEMSYFDLFRNQYRNRTIACLVIISCAILTGVDTLIYYLEFILHQFIHYHSERTIIINLLSVIMLIMSVIGIIVSEHFGRKKLLLVGYLLMSVALFMIGLLYFYNIKTYHIYLFGIILSLNTLIISPVFNLYLIEVLPEKGLALSYSFYYFIKLFLTCSFRTIVISKIGFHGQFWIYSCFSLISCIFTMISVKETMNKTLLQLINLY